MKKDKERKEEGQEDRGRRAKASLKAFLRLLFCKKKGFLKGFLEGFLKGFLEGFRKGCLEGFLKGFLQGFLKGFLKGFLRGLLKRFP